MSLIEEALRRVQDPLLQKSATAAPQAPPKKPAATPEPPAHPWPMGSQFPSPAAPPVNPLLAVTLTVLALTVLVVVGGALWMGRAIGTAPVPAQPAPAVPAESRAESPGLTLQAEAPKSQPLIAMPWAKGTEPEFTLSGVVEGPGESYAVINDLIVGIGEPVGNATLVRIAEGAVTLRRENGSEIVLRVPR